MSNLESYHVVLLLIGVVSLVITLILISSDMENYNELDDRLSNKQAKVLGLWLIFAMVLGALAIIPYVFMGLSWTFYRIVDFILTNKAFIIAMFVLPAVIFYIGWKFCSEAKNLNLKQGGGDE